MKVQLLCRPDHSLFLYQYLKKRIEMQMITFNVAKKDTWLHKLHPKAKLVDEEVTILYDFIFYAQLLFKLGKKGWVNPYRWESKYAEIAYRRAARHYHPDLIHYWPIYCHKYVRSERSKRSVATIADVYSAYPWHQVETIQPEFDKYGLDIRKSYFYIDAQRNIEFLEHETHVITNSDYVKDSFLQKYPHIDIQVASYGFLGDEATPGIYNHAITLKQYSLARRLRLVYVGTVSVEKGVPYLIEAMKKAGGALAQLDIIGPIRHDQKKVFEAYQSVPNVTFAGFRSNQEVKQTLPAYDVLVLPSLSDAYSMAVIEGMQNALPVIITGNTGNKDDVLKYQVGEVVPAANVEALVQAIEKMADVEYRKNLVHNIMHFIREDLANPYPLKVLDIYKKLLHAPLHGG